MKNLWFALSILPCSMAFSFPTPQTGRHRTGLNSKNPIKDGTFDPLHFSAHNGSQQALLPALASAASLLLVPNDALAAGPDWGLFEGRSASLLHPLAMSALFGMSLYTGFKGLQYRTFRTIPDEISQLKQTLPTLAGAASVRDALQLAQKEENVDAQRIQALQAALPIQEQIDNLAKQRKDLASQNIRDIHYSSGALLAFVGTLFAIEGPLNTYARAGKLFPGPHLYAGASLVVLWALATACIPAMQKGNDTARSIHIAANVLGTSLFAWQVVTGLPILFKVIEFTSWP